MSNETRHIAKRKKDELEIRELNECVEYVQTLAQFQRVRTVGDLLTGTAYVYLTRCQRLGLVWRILKTLFWK